jgi:hypothetical protein
VGGANPEDIELADEDEDEEGGAADGGLQVQQKEVPEAVFGQLAKRQRADGGD